MYSIQNIGVLELVLLHEKLSFKLVDNRSFTLQEGNKNVLLGYCEESQLHVNITQYCVQGLVPYLCVATHIKHFKMQTYMYTIGYKECLNTTIICFTMTPFLSFTLEDWCMNTAMDCAVLWNILWLKKFWPKLA